LAEHIVALHASSSGDGRIASLVAGIDDNGDIPRRYGISFEQLAKELREREESEH
jgi:hypothetical protein